MTLTQLRNLFLRPSGAKAWISVTLTVVGIILGLLSMHTVITPVHAGHGDEAMIQVLDTEGVGFPVVERCSGNCSLDQAMWMTCALGLLGIALLTLVAGPILNVPRDAAPRHPLVLMPPGRLWRSIRPTRELLSISRR